jgi:hypothetical protein
MRNAAGYSPQAFPHRITTGGLVDCGAFHFVQFARFVRCKNRGAKLPGAARNEIPVRNYHAVRFRCPADRRAGRLKGVTGPRSAPLTPTRYPAPSASVPDTAVWSRVPHPRRAVPCPAPPRPATFARSVISEPHNPRLPLDGSHAAGRSKRGLAFPEKLPSVPSKRINRQFLRFKVCGQPARLPQLFLMATADIP